MAAITAFGKVGKTCLGIKNEVNSAISLNIMWLSAAAFKYPAPELPPVPTRLPMVRPTMWM